jgi:hypothetical protein
MNTKRMTRRLAGLAAAAVLAVTAGATAATPAQAAAQWQCHQTDSDYWCDSISLDTDGNGRPNEYYFDLDGDVDRVGGGWDTHLWSSVGGDDFYEELTYNMIEGRSGVIHLWDVDQREGFDRVEWYGDQVPYNSAYDVLTDMGLTGVRIPGGEWVYNPYQ